MKPEFSQQILEKNPQMSNFMKIRPVGAELFRADGRTDTTKLIVAFHNFVNAPKSYISRSQFYICIYIYIYTHTHTHTYLIELRFELRSNCNY